MERIEIQFEIWEDAACPIYTEKVNKDKAEKELYIAMKNNGFTDEEISTFVKGEGDMYLRGKFSDRLCIQEENIIIENGGIYYEDLIGDLKDNENINIFRIFKNHLGQQMIKVLGYFYEGDDCWKHLEFGGLEMPIEEWLNASDETRELWESEVKQYITDMTEHEAAVAFHSYEAKSIALKDVNDNTPEGSYL